MCEMIVPAKTERLDEVIEFVESQLQDHGCPMKIVISIEIAVEEIFVNIANYGYPDREDGTASIKMAFDDDEVRSVRITFTDFGIPYDPLAKADPDVSLSAEERDIGGLGIFMVKKSMDDVAYIYKDGQNHLSIVKKF